ncbi:MAG: hypothetical protein K1000chlam2_01022 [Chlamydiae bacterium]|nr:hypothetical protein [Chlamydiota bacterium]
MNTIQDATLFIGNNVREYICPMFEDGAIKDTCINAAEQYGIAAVGVATLVIIGTGLTIRALSSRKVETIEENIEKFVKKDGVNFQEVGTGDTLLITACKANNFTMVSEILKHKPNVNLGNAQRDTPLHISCEKANREITEILFKNGAKSDTKNTDGKTPAEMIDEKNAEFSKFFNSRKQPLVNT